MGSRVVPLRLRDRMRSIRGIIGRGKRQAHLDSLALPIPYVDGVGGGLGIALFGRLIGGLGGGFVL
jgi:hypothetical protein